MSYIKEFELYLLSKGKSDNTVSGYIRDTKAFINWYQSKNDCSIEKIIELDTVEYKKFLQRTNQAIITVNRKIASINAFLKWMRDKGYIANDIAVTRVKDKDTKQYKGLEDKDLWKLRNEIHRSGNLMHICMIEILIGTGIRVSELTSIKLMDILMTDRKGTLTVIGKGNAKRTIPLNKDTRKAVKKYLEVRSDIGEEHLFIGQRGALQRNAINLILKQYGDRVQVAVTPHKLRHTLGYTLVRQGTPLTTIQQILGHDHISTTNLYTMTTQKDMAEALESIEW